MNHNNDNNDNMNNNENSEKRTKKLSIGKIWRTCSAGRLDLTREDRKKCANEAKKEVKKLCCEIRERWSGLKVKII